MLRRWHVVMLIVVTLAAFCVLAAAKLRATPKYDRENVGITSVQATALLGQSQASWGNSEEVQPFHEGWGLAEGDIVLQYRLDTAQAEDGSEELSITVAEKTITRRGPLERLAWLAGWR